MITDRFNIRVWDIKNQRLGFTDTPPSIQPYINYVVQDVSYLHIQAKECIFMQSTGLADQADVELYEGDIIMLDLAACAHRALVAWQDGSMGVSILKPSHAARFMPLSDLHADVHRIEIIGNLHEHPEKLT